MWFYKRSCDGKHIESKELVRLKLIIFDEVHIAIESTCKQTSKIDKVKLLQEFDEDLRYAKLDKPD